MVADACWQGATQNKQIKIKTNKAHTHKTLSVEEAFDVDVVFEAGGVVRDREFGHAVSVLGRRGGGQSS